jgi:hypothetical protein
MMADPTPTTSEFSVYQFFRDDTWEEVLRSVDARAAVYRAKDLIDSVGGRIGTTARVVITDGGDLITFEWIHGKGIVFPPPPERAAVDAE